MSNMLADGLLQACGPQHTHTDHLPGLSHNTSLPPPLPPQALIRAAVGTLCQPWQRIAVLQVLRSFCADAGLMYRWPIRGWGM